MEVFEGVKHFNEWKIKRRGTFLKCGRYLPVVPFFWKALQLEVGPPAILKLEV